MIFLLPPDFLSKIERTFTTSPPSFSIALMAWNKLEPLVQVSSTTATLEPEENEP